MSAWAGLGNGSSPYALDNQTLSSQQSAGNVLAGSGMGYAQPPIESQVAGVRNYGGSVSPSPVNGYPVFSSSQASASSPGGYANANPVGATPDIIAAQARAAQQQRMPINPAMPAPPNMNPWNITQSSGSGDALGYPSGRQSPIPKIATL